MAKIIFIYGLKCPIDKEIRYVGITDDLERRFHGHLKNNCTGQSYKKTDWVKKLKKLGLKPSLVVLSLATKKNAKKKEREIIHKFKKDGILLYNNQHYLTKRDLSYHREIVKIRQLIKEIKKWKTQTKKQ